MVLLLFTPADQSQPRLLVLVFDFVKARPYSLQAGNVLRGA